MNSFQNLVRSIKLGIAEMVDFRTMTTESVREKVKCILEDPKYSENMKKLSAQFKDQKEKPLERAIWWIEWLLRNPNAEEFLKSPVLRLGFIVGNSYDIIAVISIISLVVLITIVTFLITVLIKNNRNHEKFE